MNTPSTRLSSGERATLTFLRWGAGAAFLLVALPAPIYFLLRRLAATTPEDAAIFMWLTIISLVAGSLAGLFIAAVLLFYRGRKIKNLRERLATDGITADELQWFRSEWTKSERRALKEVESKNRLLADAYRETLAARITATRVLSHARGEKVVVERRLAQTANFSPADARLAERDLRDDLKRLDSIERDAGVRERETQARLQMIEAAASRDATEAQTQLALQRLEAARNQPPLGLEAAREQMRARNEIENELRIRNP